MSFSIFQKRKSSSQQPKITNFFKPIEDGSDQGKFEIFMAYKNGLK
jgi:hypothetical protein